MIVMNQDEFKGEAFHSTKYSTAGSYAGKKVAVIGACTSGMAAPCTPLISPSLDLVSGHDVAADFYNHGIGLDSLSI
jgi:hypothetical protein